MGGAIDVPGNVSHPLPALRETPIQLHIQHHQELTPPTQISPLAEFNTHADAVAAARVYALTSPTPSSTMPPPLPPQNPTSSSSSSPPPYLPPYPSPLPSRLKLTLFPLDITTGHVLTHTRYASIVTPLQRAGSPLAAWTEAFLAATWRRTAKYGALSLHDPLCVWFAIVGEQGWEIARDQDVRVETAGQWTRGACVVDRRGNGRKHGDGEVPGDHGGWLSERLGNRMSRAVSSPGDDETEFAARLLERVFGVERAAL